MCFRDEETWTDHTLFVDVVLVRVLICKQQKLILTDLSRKRADQNDIGSLTEMVRGLENQL